MLKLLFGFWVTNIFNFCPYSFANYNLHYDDYVTKKFMSFLLPSSFHNRLFRKTIQMWPECEQQMYACIIRIQNCFCDNDDYDDNINDMIMEKTNYTNNRCSYLSPAAISVLPTLNIFLKCFSWNQISSTSDRC